MYLFLYFLDTIKFSSQSQLDLNENNFKHIYIIMLICISILYIMHSNIVNIQIFISLYFLFRCVASLQPPLSIHPHTLKSIAYAAGNRICKSFWPFLTFNNLIITFVGLSGRTTSGISPDSRQGLTIAFTRYLPGT